MTRTTALLLSPLLLCVSLSACFSSHPLDSPPGNAGGDGDGDGDGDGVLSMNPVDVSGVTHASVWNGEAWGTPTLQTCGYHPTFARRDCLGGSIEVPLDDFNDCHFEWLACWSPAEQFTIVAGSANEMMQDAWEADAILTGKVARLELESCGERIALTYQLIPGNQCEFD